ncbi:MAG: hypothetical protein PHV32_12475 [Eubacteriales bacterium]|nr:hypothetical protein [Eubacteriales bacterium]
MMKTIKILRNFFALLFALCLLLTGWFVFSNMPYSSLASGIASALCMILFGFQGNLLFKVRLILDNRILTVPSAVIVQEESNNEHTVDETVVSTFGALVGDSVYKWGCDGINGARLISIEIDKLRIALTFGSKVQTLKLELLHGLDNTEKVSQVKQKFLHETGIEATVSGW